MCSVVLKHFGTIEVYGCFTAVLPETFVSVGALMSNLCRRLRALHVEDKTVSLPKDEFSGLSVAELDATKLGFGRKHTNATYLEIWTTDQAYVKRFLDHYHSSAQPLHRKFVYYCSLKIERAELEGRKIVLTHQPASISGPVDSSPQVDSAPGPDDAVIWECESWHLPASDPCARLQALEERVTRMETLLNDIAGRRSVDSVPKDGAKG